jgi:hypothetical protein
MLLWYARRLTAVQWIALVTLACGTATSQLPTAHGRRHAEQHSMALGGAALSVVSCLLSALGGESTSPHTASS